MTTRSKTATRTSEGDVNKAFAKPVDVKGAARTADAAENQIHLGILFAHVALGSACSLVKGPRLVGQCSTLVLQHLSLVYVCEHYFNIFLPARHQRTFQMSENVFACPKATAIARACGAELDICV